jgi:hypothetical protein
MANNANTGKKQKDFYSFLVEELIENNYDSVGCQNRENILDRGPQLVTLNGLARCGIEANPQELLLMGSIRVNVEYVGKRQYSSVVLTRMKMML